MLWMTVAMLSCETASSPSDTEQGTTLATTQGTGADSTVGTTSGLTATFGMEGPADEGDEAGFVPPLDVSCAGGAGVAAHCALCDVREQNCLDTFKCVPWADDGGDAWTSTKCIGTALSPVPIGEACTVTGEVASGRDDCEAGSMCWAADPTTLMGTCVPFCAPSGESPACDDGRDCMLDGFGVLAVCLPACDPLDVGTCARGETCRYFPASANAFCLPDQGGEVLVPTVQCGSADEACDAAEVCISASTFGGCGDPSCCTAWCDLNDPMADSQCAASRSDHACLPVFDDGSAPRSLAHLGFCGVPARSR